MSLANVNFKLLLDAHGGDMGRAKEAWKRICQLGQYGDVPETYEGGLDVKGLNIALEESSQGQYRRGNPKYGRVPGAPEILFIPPVHRDDVKRIEDIASGDKVRR